MASRVRPFVAWLVMLLACGVFTALASVTVLFNRDAPGGNTYYVSTTGNDTNNDCTEAQSELTPKRNIKTSNGGISCLQSGDTLIIKAGTYVEGDIGLNAPTIPSGTGDSDRTTVRAETGETVIIQPASGTGVMFIYSKQYITIQDIIFDGISVGGNGVYVGRQAVSGFAPSTNITLSGCTFRNADTVNSAAGVYLGYNQDTVPTDCSMRLLNSTAHNNGSGNLGHGVYSSCRGVLIDGGEFYSNQGHGIHVYSHGAEMGPTDANAWTGTSGTLVRNTIVRDNFTTGIGLYNGTGNYAYNNLVYDNTGAGGAISARFNCDACKIYNNTVYSNDSVSGAIFLTSSAAGNNQSQGIEVKNNLIIDNAGSPINDGALGTICSNNLSGITGSCFLNFTATAAATFVNPGTLDLHLLASSPAIGAGADLSATLTTDYEGDTRSLPFDVGADEFVDLTQSITLFVPNGGENWLKTNTHTITWSSANITNVRIRVDRGNDGTFEETVSASTPSDGSFDWTPGGDANPNVKLEICDQADNTPCAVSAATFRISDAGGASITKVISKNTIGSHIGDLQGIVDTRILEQSPTTNWSNDPTLVVQKFSSTLDGNTILIFPDWSQIPPTATVTSVTLGLYLTGVTGSATHTIDVRKLLRNVQIGETTWNVYSTGNNWNTAGGLGNGSDRVSTALAQLTGIGTATGQFYTVTQNSGALVDYVQQVADGTEPNNYGIHLETNGAGNDSNIKGFASSEGVNGTRPFFSMTYSTVAATINVTQPVSGQVVYPGEFVTVRWQTEGISGNLNFHSVCDNGVTTTIASSIPHTNPDLGWLVPLGSSGSCVVRATSINDGVTGSSGVFRKAGLRLKFKL